MAGTDDWPDSNKRFWWQCFGERGQYKIRKGEVLVPNKCDGRPEVPEAALQSSDQQSGHEVQDGDLQSKLQDRGSREVGSEVFRVYKLSARLAADVVVEL